MNTPKQNQQGFGSIEIILIIIVLALVGGGGWYVYKHRTKTAPTQNTQSTTTETKPAKKQKEYKIPDGYTVYENKELGFKFAYPKDWGALTSKAAQDASLNLETPSVPFTDYDKVTLTVWTNKTTDFKSRPYYKQITYSPTLDGASYVWKYADSAYGHSLGEVANPQPSKTLETDSITTYGVASGDGCGGSQQWLFPVKDSFVGVNIDYGNCYGLALDDITTEKAATFKASYDKLVNDIKSLPSTIRVNAE